MSIRVVAAGRVTAGPSRLLGEDSWEVFVLDPFPGSAGARLVHACEVVCGSQDLASSALTRIRRGDLVEVTGELVMERIQGPMEDDLSGARVWIKATDPVRKSGTHGDEGRARTLPGAALGPRENQ